MKSAWVNKGDILLKYFLSVFIYSVLSIFVMLNLRMLLSWKINDRKFRRNRHEKGFGKIWMNLAQRNGKLCMNRLLFWLNVVLSFVLVMFSSWILFAYMKDINNFEKAQWYRGPIWEIFYWTLSHQPPAVSVSELWNMSVNSLCCAFVKCYLLPYDTLILWAINVERWISYEKKHWWWYKLWICECRV